MSKEHQKYSTENQAGKPFSRDVSIFGQSGGFTLSKLGLHRVWCSMQLGQSVLTSSKIDLWIRPPRTDQSLAARLLRNQDVQRLLFYRRTRKLNDVLNVAAQTPDIEEKEIAGALHYALARCFETAASKRRKKEINFKKLMGEHAKRATDAHDYLGERQLHHLSRIIDL